MDIRYSLNKDEIVEALESYLDKYCSINFKFYDDKGKQIKVSKVSFEYENQ